MYCTVRCELFTFLCTVHCPLQCIMYFNLISKCKSYIVLFTLQYNMQYKIQCTVHRKVYRTMQCLRYKILCKVQYTAYGTIYNLQCNIQCTVQYTIYSTLYVYCAARTLIPKKKVPGCFLDAKVSKGIIFWIILTVLKKPEVTLHVKKLLFQTLFPKITSFVQSVPNSNFLSAIVLN